MVVSGMDAAVLLARRHWDGEVRAVRDASAVVGFALELTTTAELVADAAGIRVVRPDGSVIHAQAAVEHGTAIEICGAVASAAVDFWRELESGLGQPRAEAGIIAVLGPELGPEGSDRPLDAALVHLVVHLHRERAVKFERAVWGGEPSLADPDRPIAAEPVVLGEPIDGAEQAFFLPLPPDGTADPLWQRAAEVGAEAGRAWRRDHAPDEDGALDAMVAARVRSAFRLPARRWVVAAVASLVLVPAGVFAVVSAFSTGARAGAGPVIGVVVAAAIVAVILALLFRSALADHRRRRSDRQWALQVALHRAHEAARTWHTSRVRWSARDLE